MFKIWAGFGYLDSAKPAAQQDLVGTKGGSEAVLYFIIPIVLLETISSLKMTDSIFGSNSHD